MIAFLINKTKTFSNAFFQFMKTRKHHLMLHIYYSKPFYRIICFFFIFTSITYESFIMFNGDVKWRKNTQWIAKNYYMSDIHYILN